MPELTLCCFPGTCARATMIALEEAGAAYDTRLYDLMKDEQRAPDYLAINPKGQVPVLIADGTPLSESVAILGYLASRFPEARLAPEDPMQRAQALSVISWLASGVLTTLLRIVRPYRITDDNAAFGGIQVKARMIIRDNMALANTHLAGRTWWLDEWSVADAYLYYMAADAAVQGVDLAGFGHLAAHATAMEARPAVQRMLAWEARTRAVLGD